ncbi:TrlF family AAA-like ATPase [Brucella pseudogrignonensis]|uniref:TrlF family AAA-like ATPase n=1 Tax=Brucella pseudogrignonensis TaxID=419475 RepID=UPI001AEEF03A|nr:AAA family ATPase [Brucella pseudogrignonensis]
MGEAIQKFLAHGAQWGRADFHLHTKADKEFRYEGEDNRFVSEYVDALEGAGIRLAVITNHNKFDLNEFKALRKRARKAGIGVLAGVELSVKDGANGVHTLVVFSDAWLADGQDFINQFLGVAFAGKVPSQYEQENGRSNDDLIETLKRLESYNRDFFIIFAHVESNSGLWKEIGGGRMEELAADPLIQKYALGFQKVRTHDKPDAVCRMKVRGWWGDHYPAEVEGSDAKAIDEIGKGEKVYLKLGDLSFDAVKFALTDHNFRVSRLVPAVQHSHVNAIRFEGGLLDGKRVTFSPHLNCLIGIQGSGKSSILESVRYALDIPFGDRAQDKEYKDGLLPHVLKSGGKVVVEATDRHGGQYEISRILGHSSDVYVEGTLRPGLSIKETIIAKPLYFGQKDLSAAGKGFGHDLIEKLMGDGLKAVRQNIAEKSAELKTAIENFNSVRSDAEEKQTLEDRLKDIEFNLEHFDKYGIKDQLEKQLAYSADFTYCQGIDATAQSWHKAIDSAVTRAEDEFKTVEAHSSQHNDEFFARYDVKVAELKATVTTAKNLVDEIKSKSEDLGDLRKELEGVRDELKEEFAETERELVKALEVRGVTSIQPDAYIKLTQLKQEIEGSVAELANRTGKEKYKRDAVVTALTSLNDAWRAEYMLIAAALKIINESQGSLRVEAEFKGDRNAFKIHIEAVLRGHSFRKEYYDALGNAYVDFGEIFKDIDIASTHARGKSEEFKKVFLENLYQLTCYQVPNKYDVKYHGKALSSHSLGQRASAMMLFLLSQDGNDLLLIDQPEDDLDSQTVYEEVVKLLRNLKPKQQFIFATHNANFPVLGDAETITTCSASDDEIVISVGNIDDRACQASVISIMEGGPEAFERRKAIYQIWKADTADNKGAT